MTLWLTVSQWTSYHEVACGPGPPWDCPARCVLWRRFDAERQKAEQLRAAGVPVPTYGELERKP